MFLSMINYDAVVHDKIMGGTHRKAVICLIFNIVLLSVDIKETLAICTYAFANIILLNFLKHYPVPVITYKNLNPPMISNFTTQLQFDVCTNQKHIITSF